MCDVSQTDLMSGFIGALVGGLLSLAGTYISNSLQANNSKKAEEKLIMGLLQSIHDEVETLWELYMNGVGANLEALAERQPFLFFWPITQDYFTVYATNAFLIGRINNHDLRKLIIAVYSRSRGLVDSFRLNNDMVQKRQNCLMIFAETKNPVHQQQGMAFEAALSEYAAKIRKSHFEVKALTSDLLRALRKQGVLSPSSKVK
ncbi:MAG: hypothetical protein SFW65_04695 [Alphaproteobacteria bacterium]|nr:hypothetical protein [Alphaproteobacteria bacterium]